MDAKMYRPVFRVFMGNGDALVYTAPAVALTDVELEQNARAMRDAESLNFLDRNGVNVILNSDVLKRTVMEIHPEPELLP